MMSQGADPSRRPRNAWKRNPLFRFLASLRLAVILLGVLIIMSIAGTLAESKFDSDTARTWIYEAPWFSLWIALLVANLFCSTLTRWPWRKHHAGFLLTHLAIIVIIIGAVVGQTWGIEGTMTLFKGAPPDNQLVLQRRQITIRDHDAKSAVLIELGRQPLRIRSGRPVELWTTPGGWKVEAVANSPRLLTTFEPESAPEGRPAVLVRLRTRTMSQTVEQWLLTGDRDHSRLNLGLITVDLVEAGSAAPETGPANRAVIQVAPDGKLTAEIFTHGQRGAEQPLAFGQPLATGWLDWTLEAVQELPAAKPSFRFAPLPTDAPVPAGQSLIEGLLVRASRNGEETEQWVGVGWRASLRTGNFPVEVSYGWKVHRLPFGLVLKDFVVERNEGTDDPASFRSDLAMVLPDGTVAATGSCSMNEPANYPDAWWRSLTGLTYKISQASWNPEDPTQSAVQILRDPGWLFKWVGSLILCAGLITLFTLGRSAKSPTRHAKPKSL